MRGKNLPQFKGGNPENVRQRQFRLAAEIHSCCFEDRLQAIALAKLIGLVIRFRNIQKDVASAHCGDKGLKNLIGDEH